MKKKKLLSAVMVGSLVAAQMVMPVAAAGGTFDVSVTEKTAVLRVEVPTSLEIAIDELEIGDFTQIYSSEFTMRNKSTVPVNVKVTSTVKTMDSGITLAATPENLADDNAWLAVAAKVDEDGYGVDNPRELNTESRNVTTFTGSTPEAVQQFYLSAGSEDSVYKLFETSASKLDVSAHAGAAEYVKVTEIASADQDALYKSDGTGAITTDNVYEVNASGAVIKLWEKGDTTIKFTSGNTYYTTGAVGSMTTETDIAETVDSSKYGFYVYEEAKEAASEDDGVAAFRYIGKLGAKSDETAWDKTDITEITIAYEIKGAGSALYEEKLADCVYGLYVAPTRAALSADNNYKLKAGTAMPLGLSLGSGSTEAEIVSVCPKGLNYDLLGKGLITYENGTLTFPASTVDTILGTPTTYLPEKNNTQCTCVITLNVGGETETLEFVLTSK